jgi:hypothetical protein
MLEILVAFTVPWVAFLWAVDKFVDDYILGTKIAFAGAFTAEAGLLVALMDIQRFQAECTVQAIVHSVTLPCKVPSAYEVLVPALYVATALNAGIVVAGTVLSFYRLVKQLKQHSKPRSA